MRMLRAIRFAAKLNFDIEDEAAAAIHECGRLLAVIPPARMFDEVVKLFHSGSALRAFALLLREFNLLKYLVPALDEWLQDDPSESMLDFIDQALVNTDTRVNTGQPVSPGFIFAVLLWPVVWQQANEVQSDRHRMIPALVAVGETVMKRQVRHISIPAPLQPDGARYLERATALSTAPRASNRNACSSSPCFAPPTTSCASRQWLACFRTA